MNSKKKLLNKKSKNKKGIGMQFLVNFIKQKEQQNIILGKMLHAYKPSEKEK